MKIAISEIKINSNRRAIDKQKVKELSESIKEIGLINPITITENKELIAGVHRIEAVKMLDCAEIECSIVNLEGLFAELAEIDENLIRNELHYIEHGKQLLRRKAIYEELYPDTKAGGDRKSEEIKRRNPSFDKLSFVADTSAKTNKSQTVIKEELQIAHNIIPEVQETIKENDINKSDALKISRLEPEQQKKVIEQIVNKPHIAYNSGNNEWYTPPEYIEAARNVMGIIELDPASSELANETVQAKHFFTVENDGLKQEWHGKAWMNPPYAVELIGQFCKKLTKHFYKDDISEAIVLVNNATETGWFNMLIEQASAIVFPKTRVKFRMPNGETGAPLQGQAVIYFGKNSEKFIREFKPFGWSAYL